MKREPRFVEIGSAEHLATPTEISSPTAHPHIPALSVDELLHPILTAFRKEVRSSSFAAHGAIARIRVPTV